MHEVHAAGLVLRFIIHANDAHAAVVTGAVGPSSIHSLLNLLSVVVDCLAAWLIWLAVGRLIIAIGGLIDAMQGAKNRHRELHHRGRLARWARAARTAVKKLRQA